MRLFSFESENKVSRFGIEAGGILIDVNLAEPRLPSDLKEFLCRPDWDLLRELEKNPPLAASLAHTVKRLPPVSNPGKILCVGTNYHAHILEMNLTVPVAPNIFAKFANVLVGDGADVFAPNDHPSFDYEAELAVVIGTQAKNVSKADALKFVAGYTIFNDLSVRSLQMRTSQFTMGKSGDTHGPCGPVIVTADEIPDPQNLKIKLSIGSELLQDANTSEMIFGVAEIIESLTSVMTLEPGDIISTGSPAGAGAGRNPQRWLKKGETMRIEIERIGILQNTVR